MQAAPILFLGTGQRYADLEVPAFETIVEQLLSRLFPTPTPFLPPPATPTPPSPLDRARPLDVAPAPTGFFLCKIKQND